MPNRNKLPRQFWPSGTSGGRTIQPDTPDLHYLQGLVPDNCFQYLGNFASESALVPWKSKTSFLMGFHWVTRLGLIIKTSRSWYSVLLYIFLSLSLCIPPRKSHEATASPASMVVTSLSLKFFALLTLYQFSVHFKTVHLWLLPINMVVSCCVINCTNRFNKYNPRSFYRIPKKPDDRRKSWIAAIKRVSPNGQQWEPTVATVMIFLLKHHIYLYFFT